MAAGSAMNPSVDLKAFLLLRALVLGPNNALSLTTKPTVVRFKTLRPRSALKSYSTPPPPNTQNTTFQRGIYMFKRLHIALFTFFATVTPPLSQTNQSFFECPSRCGGSEVSSETQKCMHNMPPRRNGYHEKRGPLDYLHR